MSLNCNQAKEQLEELLERLIDHMDLPGNEVSISPECQEHLNVCSDCRDYQAASRVLIESALALPVLAVPKGDLLTANIMKAVLAETSQKSLEPIQQSGPMQIRDQIQGQWREIGFLLLSFVAFAAASGYGMQLDESLWNIGSWMIALTLFISLKPVFEGNKHSTGMAA